MSKFLKRYLIEKISPEIETLLFFYALLVYFILKDKIGFWFYMIFGVWALCSDIKYLNPKFFSDLKFRFQGIFIEEYWGDLMEKRYLMKKAGRPNWVISLWTVYSYLSLISPQVIFKIKKLFVYEKKVDK